MFNKRALNSAAILATLVMLTACGPGGGNSSDVFPRETQPTAAITGPNSFLLFPNPQQQDDGTVQTNTTAYATAYYEAIDASNAKDTLEKWKAANGFGNTSTGTETTVVFGDVKDLGYGRRMTARKNNDGSLAFMVENYLVGAVASYSYSDLNVEAAVVSDKRWHVGTNGIEYSATTCIANIDPASTPAGICDSTIKFTKFYTFEPKTGVRLLEAQLDGRGKKAMPGICITCHGGRGDPLTPSAGSPNSKQLFPVVGNTKSKKRGDVMANLQPLKVDSFGYSSRTGYSRAEQEENLKTINKMVLSSYPMAASSVYPEDALRRYPNTGEWVGTAAALIKNAYGGDGLPNATFTDTYLPPSWSAASSGQATETLYKSVITQSCRTCHILRGNTAMSQLNFDKYCTVSGVCSTETDFYGYADRIRAHVIDRGNMPLAKIVYENMWSTSQPDTLATFLVTAGQPSSAVRDTSGAVLKPGRPVAIAGLSRTTTSPVTLSGSNSLFASSYSWSLVSGSATLSNATSATPTLTGGNGVNVVRLIVSNSTTQSQPVDVTITIDSNYFGAGKLPASPTFADIKAVLQGPPSCSGCHTAGGGPPIFYTDYDRNGDGLVQTAYGQTDDRWFYTELRGRINFADVAASPLLKRPRGLQHGAGSVVFNFTDVAACTAPCGGTTAYAQNKDYFMSAYNMFVNWISNGAPY